MALEQVTAELHCETAVHGTQTSAGPLPSSQKPGRHAAHCAFEPLLQVEAVAQPAMGAQSGQESAPATGAR